MMIEKRPQRKAPPRIVFKDEQLDRSRWPRDRFHGTLVP